MPPKEQEIKLKIGEMGVSLKWERMRLRRWPHPFYRDFFSEAETEINLRIYRGQSPFFSKEKMIFDGQDNHWKLYQANGRYIIEIFDPEPPHLKSKIAFMEDNFSFGEVYIISNGKAQASWYPPDVIRPLVEILIVNRLSLGQGILIHALGIDDHGRGEIFIGPSGAGKSTLAKFYMMKDQNSPVLNDEHLIIKKVKDRLLVFGTPWPGGASTVSCRSLPIDKIFFIQHAKENIARPLGLSSSFSNLFPQIFLPFWDKKRLELSVDFCKELIKNIPCYSLGFVKDKSVVDFIKRV